MTYSNDIRRLVCKRIESGATHREVAAEFGLAPSTAGRFAKEGFDSDRPKIKRKRRLDAYRTTLLAWVEERRDMTLREMAERLFCQFGLRFSRSTISDWWLAQGYTYKKRRRMPTNKTAQM